MKQRSALVAGLTITFLLLVPCAGVDKADECDVFDPIADRAAVKPARPTRPARG